MPTANSKLPGVAQASQQFGAAAPKKLNAASVWTAPKTVPKTSPLQTAKAQFPASAFKAK